MNQQQVLKAAIKIALKSREDDLFLITSDAVKLEQGMYNGWLLKPPSVIDTGYGIWCFATQKNEAGNEVVERIKGVKERVAKIVGLEPEITLIEKWFKVVKVVKVEEKEKYAVYDFEPTKEEVTAVLAYVHVCRRRRGRGEACRVMNKLKAEFNEEVEVGEAGVYVPYDVQQLSTAVARLMTTGRGVLWF